MKVTSKYLFIFLGLTQLLFSKPIQDRKIDSIALAELLSAFDIDENDDIVALTQEKWLRKANHDRWEMTSLSEDKNKLVLNWAYKNNFFNQWEPNRKHYDFALILGATTESMQKRLDFLAELYNNGTRFNEVIWLTGERPLNPQSDNIEFGKTESDAAEFIWKNSDLPLKMKDIPTKFIKVKMKLKNGCLVRPNTQDTIVGWLKKAPESCTALFVSNQPYCGYQFSVIKSAISKNISFDVVGKGIDLNDYKSANIILDTIARWIYQDNLQSKLH